jgi:hypothetical protein
MLQYPLAIATDCNIRNFPYSVRSWLSQLTVDLQAGAGI